MNKEASTGITSWRRWIGWNKLWKVALGSAISTVALAVIVVLIWYAFWVSFVDNHEFGFVYDKLTGEIAPIEHNGWVTRTPFRYSIHAIDTRPYQVSISANARILNAKLVRFNSAGLKTFIKWHGREAGDSVYNLTEILKCYAFDRDEGRDCPFLEVVSVLQPSQGEAQMKQDDKEKKRP